MSKAKITVNSNGSLKIEGDFALKYIEKKKKTSVFDLMESLETAANKLNIDTLTQNASAPRLMFK